VPSSETPADGTAAVDPLLITDPQIQNIPEQYVVLVKVSEGGMGAIYRVKNRYTGALYAVKILKPEFAKNVVCRQRFVLEAKAASALNHPCICRVHDFGMMDETPYLVMEWIDGISLERKVFRDGPLPQAEALPIFQQVASALAHAHQHQVVHRDLKPDNIMLSRKNGDNAVHLVDFGIAKLLSQEDYARKENLTATGTVMGTPLYMSPEQARGADVDVRCDIYSFGCVMYMALTGQPPFRGNSFIDTIYMHVNSPPPPIDPKLDIAADLKSIVLKAMEKDPANRYQTIEKLASDLSKRTKGVEIGLIHLNADKQRRKQQLVNVLYFIVAFAAIYSLSIALQNYSDAKHKADSHSQP
jgi:serine/threonine protein kinase